MRYSKIALVYLFVFLGLVVIFVGCSGSNNDIIPSTNLVFVITQDLTYNAGDVNPETANLSNQGLQRALMLGKYIKTNILNSANPNGIYALQPCTHLQTVNNYPNMVPLIVMEQFALLNQYPLPQSTPAQDVVAASFPIKVSYTEDSLPPVAAAQPYYIPECQGIDFADNKGGNVALVSGIIEKKQSGYYVFAMPFDTFQSLVSNLKELKSYNYKVPDVWEGPNIVYVLTIPITSSTATLRSHDTQLKPKKTYPTPSVAYQPEGNLEEAFTIQPSTMIGSSVPDYINRNQTIYFIRHGEAHPTDSFDNGNLVMQGNWRALYLPGALEGKIETPDIVYAPDPSQAFIGMPADSQSEYSFYSYIRPSMTVAPYAIAKGLPLLVASGFQVGSFDPDADAEAVEAAIKFFFTEGRFTDKTLLVGWEHVHIQKIAQSLVNKYFDDPSDAPTVPAWPGSSPDYDTVWTFSLDSDGNLTVSNLIYQGIKSSTLPSTAPVFD
jgi:hypothetical protein